MGLVVEGVVDFVVVVVAFVVAVVVVEGVVDFAVVVISFEVLGAIGF